MDYRLLESTVDSVVAQQASIRGGEAAVICGEDTLTFRELHEAARSLATWMKARGVRSGDHISVWLPNGLAWVVVHVAAAQAGAVTVPISTRLTRSEAEFIVRHANSRMLVVLSAFLGRGYGCEAGEIARNLDGISDVELLVLESDGLHLPSGGGTGELLGSDPDAPAVVQYTSGTTGRPKGCVLSHRAWTNNARISAVMAEVTAGDVVFSPSPFFHLFGSLTALMGCLSVGACLVTTPTFAAPSAAEAIVATGASHMVAVPTVWLDLMAPPYAHSLDLLTSGRWGGGAFPQRALERALSPDGLGLQLQAIYGMTEAPTLTQTRSTDSLLSRLETVGRATAATDVRVIEPETGREVPSGVVGEIAMRGYCRAMGYLHDQEAMDARMTQDGLFRTGDLGTLDHDRYLRVTGRLTDMVISGAANIYTREVEDAILEIDEVTLAAVVPGPDARLGEVPVAWVTLRGRTHHGAEAAIISHCKSRLASYKVPRDVFVVPEMPLTASGKIHKARLMEMTQDANREASP